MPNLFTLQDGNLTDTSIYGYSLTAAEVMTGVSGVTLGTVDAYGPLFTGDGSTISAVAVHLSARQANNATDSLILKLSAAGKSVQTEYYPISNFTAYNGSNNLIADYPLNWQILKLSTGYQIPNLSSAKISLAATNSGVISLIGVSSTNNFDKALITSSLSSITTSYVLSSVNGPITLSSASPFGVGIDGSMMLSGVPTSDAGTNKAYNYLLLSSATVSSEFATTNFTMEGWFNFNNAAAGYQPLITYADDAVGDTRGLICITESGSPNSNIYLYATNSAGSWPYSINSGFTPTAGVWTHIAVVRYNGYLYLYINGISRGTPVNIGTNAIFTSSTTRLKYGQYERFPTVAVRTFGGFISNIRVAKRALYVVNFTPQNTPFNKFYDITYIYPYTSPYSSSITKVDDIHLGGSIKLSATEVRTITADNTGLLNLYVHNNGILTFPLTSNKTLTVYGSAGLQITSDGTLNIGASSLTIPLSTTHTLVLPYSQIQVHNGGNFNVYGYPKLATTYLSSSILSSSRTFTTTNSVSTTWLSGDTLVFTPNTTFKSGFDTLTLSTFTGSNTFTTTSSSVYTHLGLSSLPYVPAISNLTKNVILSAAIYGELSSNINLNDASIYNSLNYPLIDFNLNNNTLYNQNLYFNNASLGNLSASFINSATIVSYAAASLNALATTEFWLSASSFFNFSGNYSDSNNYYRLSFGSGSFTVENYTATVNTGATFYSKDIQLNKWFHFAMCVNTTGNNQSYYINGKLIGNLTLNKTIGGVLNSLDTSNPNGGGNFNIYNLRVVTGETIYKSSFSPSFNYPPPKTGTILTSLFNVAGTFNVGVVRYFNIYKTYTYNSINFTNNIFYNNYNTVFDSILIKNLKFSDNILLSSLNTGLYMNNVTSYNSQINNNTSIYSLSYGSYLTNNTITGTYGSIGYNNVLQGMWLSGVNKGVILGSGVNSLKEGVYVDTTSYNLSATSFQNIVASNNLSAGFKLNGNSSSIYLNLSGLTANSNGINGLEAYNVIGNINNTITNNNSGAGISLSLSGTNIFTNITANNNFSGGLSVNSANLSSISLNNNNFSNNSSVGVKLIGNSLNYLTPITLNINGLIASNNLDSGIEAYNICGTISSVTANANYSNGIKTSLGNGPTTFDGFTALNTSDGSFNKLSATTITGNASVSTVLGYKSIGIFSDAVSNSYYFNASPNKLIPDITASGGSTNGTVEAWVYLTSRHGIVGWDEVQLIDFGPSGWSIGISSYGFIRWGRRYIAADTRECYYSGSTQVPLNTWSHIALVISSSNFSLYLNGVLEVQYVVQNFTSNSFGAFPQGVTGFGPSLANGTYTITNTNVTINSKLNGYIRNVRILNYAKYSSNFTPEQYFTWIPNTTFIWQAPFDGWFGINSYSVNLENPTNYPKQISILSATNYNSTIFKNLLLSSTSNSYGMYITQNKLEDFRLENSTLSSFIPLSITSTRSKLEGSYTFHNSNSNIYGLSSLAISSYQSDGFSETGFSVMNENNLSSNKYRISNSGKISLDTTIVHTISNICSEKLEPWSSTIKLKSSSKFIPINIGNMNIIKVWIYKSNNYTGSAPRLMLKQNSNLNYNDTVIATSVSSNNNWEFLTGNIPFAGNTGVAEVYVDCSGAVGSGTINIDDWGIV